MQKQAPTLGRLAVMVVFALSCFGLLLFLWLSFGGPTPLKPKGYRVDVPFREAAQLATQADVRVSGVPIGKVETKRIAEDRPDVVIATLEIDDRYAPLSSDARAVLREKTLLGETYVELTLGSRDAPKIPDGGMLDERRVRSTVKLDELLDTFDEYTRASYRTWQRSLGRALDRRGADLNDALGTFPGFVRSGGDLLEVLDRNRSALEGLVRDTGTVFEALTERERQLRRLVTGTRGTFAAIARRRDSWAATWKVMPTFLRESRATSRTLEGFSLRAAPVLRDLAPATDDLAVSLRALGKAAPDLRRFLRSLDPLVDAADKGLPASSEILRGLRPLVGGLEVYLGELNPTLDWIGQQVHTLNDVLSNLGVATAARPVSRDPKARGHYLRQFGPQGAETMTIHPRRLQSNRGNAYINPMDLSSERQTKAGIIANWDCDNTGGEHPADDSGPACQVAAPYTFQGQTRRFPHVQAETYRSGRPEVRDGR